MLFLAHDGVIFGDSVREIERMIGLLEGKAAEVGIKVNKNKEKCNVIVFNGKSELVSVTGLKVM